MSSRAKLWSLPPQNRNSVAQKVTVLSLIRLPISVQGLEGLTTVLAHRFQGAAVGMGNFDGVHLGHKAVIAQAARAAGRLGAPLGIVTFSPHPKRVFQPDCPPFQLMDQEQKARALDALGVDFLYVLQFDSHLSNLEADLFCQRLLKDTLQVRHVSIGQDFCYGKGRKGTATRLAKQGADLGFEVEVLKDRLDQYGERLSSTTIRAFLAAGDVSRAAEILGRPFAVSGVVVMGDQRGRHLGFPTINQNLGDYVQPRFGVYASRTHLPDGRVIASVSNLGSRPTVGGTEPRLETHLFDFQEDLYGQSLEVELLTFLRPEQKFDGLDALKAQIAKDSAAAKQQLLPEL